MKLSKCLRPVPNNVRGRLSVLIQNLILIIHPNMTFGFSLLLLDAAAGGGGKPSKLLLHWRVPVLSTRLTELRHLDDLPERAWQVKKMKAPHMWKTFDPRNGRRGSVARARELFQNLSGGRRLILTSCESIASYKDPTPKQNHTFGVHCLGY